jgi:hypothetical protein
MLRPIHTVLPLRRGLPLLSALMLSSLACGGTGGGSSPQRGRDGVVYTDGADIWFAPLDGSGPVTLADSPDREFPLERSGDWVVYARSPQNVNTFWAVRRDGTGRTSLGALYYGVVNGRAIIDQPGDATHPQAIASVELDTGVVTTLGQAVGPSPANVTARVLGGEVYLTTDSLSPYGPPGQGQLVQIAADGTGRTVLLDLPATPWFVGAGKVLASASQVVGGATEYHYHLASRDGASRTDLGAFGQSGYGAQAYGIESEGRPFLVGDQGYFTGWDGSHEAAYQVDLPTGTLRTLVSGLTYPLYPWTALGGRLIANALTDREALVSIDGAAQTATPFWNTDGSSYVGQLHGKVLYVRRRSALWSDVDLVSSLPDGTGTTTVALAPDVQTGFRYDVGADSSRPAVVVGDRVVFRQAVNGQLELVSTLVDGTSRVVISQGAGTKGLAAVSGNVVIYRTEVDGLGDLYAVNADGTGHGALATATDDESFLAVVGATVVFQRLSPQGTGTLQAVPLQGGTATTLAPLATSVYAQP